MEEAGGGRTMRTRRNVTTAVEKGEEGRDMGTSLTRAQL